MSDRLDGRTVNANQEIEKVRETNRGFTLDKKTEEKQGWSVSCCHRDIHYQAYGWDQI